VTTPATVRVVAAVLRRGDRVLCGRRRAGLSQAGCWEFPGGKVEAGESDQSALARELAEELDLRIEVGHRLTRAVRPTADGRLIDLVCYEARLVGPEPLSSRDHDALTWQAVADLADLDFSAPDRPTVDWLRSQSDSGNRSDRSACAPEAFKRP
jgi:8-oxo-dGTP diphosphatase